MLCTPATPIKPSTSNSWGLCSQLFLSPGYQNATEISLELLEISRFFQKFISPFGYQNATSGTFQDEKCRFFVFSFVFL